MIIITGLPRSGATPLGEILADAGCAFFGEVFNPEGYDDGGAAERLLLRPEANFFRFLETYAKPKGPPTKEGQQELWYRFSAHLLKLADGKTPVIDVKYTSWHNLDEVWQTPAWMPLLLDRVVSDPDIRLLHIIRHDQLARAASEDIASRSGLWHQTGGRPEIQKSFSLPLAETLARLTEARRQLSCMCSWLAGFGVQRLFYEGTWSEGLITPAASRTIKRRTGVDLTLGHRPRTMPLNRDPSSRIENWKQIKKAAVEANLDQWPKRKV